MKIPILHRPKWKQLGIIAAVMLAAGFAVLWWWRRHDSQESTWRTAAIQRGMIEATISASGTIEPREVVDVGAQVAGLIKSFGTDVDGKPVDYNSTVKEGDVLARIDDSVYAADLAVAKAQLEQAKAGELSAAADLAQAKAKAAQAEADWKRAEELGPSEALARSLYDSYKAGAAVAVANVAVAEAAIAQAKATTVQAQAGLEKAQRNLDFSVIRSPVDGVIIDRRVNIGQTVVASLNAPSLFLIARDLTKMQIWVSVNEADVGRIKPGLPVTFTVDAFPGREFRGAVGKVRLNAQMTQNVVLYTAEINIDNPDKLLLPYLTANVRFILSHQSDVLFVPNAALRWSPSVLAQIAPSARDLVTNDPREGGPPSAKDNGQESSRCVLWLEDGAFVQPVEVIRGISDGVNTVVSGKGLREGEQVVTGESLAPASATTNPFLPRRFGR